MYYGNLFYVEGEGLGNGWDDDANMSVNASTAYSEGKMPISKWTKSKLLSAISDTFGEEYVDAKGLSKFTTAMLKDVLLEYKEWHHSSASYNCVNFYGIKDKYLGKDRNAAYMLFLDDLGAELMNRKEELAEKPKAAKPAKPVQVPLEQCPIHRGTWEESFGRYRTDVYRFESYGYVQGKNFHCLNKDGELTGKVKRISGRKFWLHEEATMETVKNSNIRYQRPGWH